MSPPQLGQLYSTSVIANFARQFGSKQASSAWTWEGVIVAVRDCVSEAISFKFMPPSVLATGTLRGKK